MKINNRRKNLTSVALIFLFISTIHNFSIAQSTNSPYSRYGIGDINNKVCGQGFALGGTTIALRNDTTAMFFINTSNPASYAGMRLTTAEMGVNYNKIRLLSSETKKNLNNASFGYISIAFPFKKWWGGSLGLIPYSSVGYSIADEQTITNVGKVKFLYEGNGGINQAYFGNGITPFIGLPRKYLKSSKHAELISRKDKTREKIYDDYLKDKQKYNVRKFLKTAAVGANVSYMFGNIANQRSSQFTSSNSFNTRTGTVARVTDFYADYGFQIGYTIDSLRSRNPKYDKDSARLDSSYDSVVKYKFRDLRENVQVLFGLNFAAQTDLNAKIDSLSVNYYTSGAGFDFVKDTVEFVEGHKGTITFPLTLGFGLALKKGERWLVAGDFAMQNWSSFQAFNQNQGLKNSMRISVGTQYVPNSKAPIKQYLKRVHYRIGVRYTQTALELKNSQLSEYAASIGFGFPVGRNYLLQNFSMVNIGVEVGQRGTTANGLIKEQFIKTTIGFTINDRWFVKPKID
jgi:hypothetical protein